MTYSDLTSLIASGADKLNSKSGSQAKDYHKVWADVYNKEFESSLAISGAYVGAVPGAGPDPLNGNYDFKFGNFSLSDSLLEAGAKAGFGSWAKAIETAYKLVVVNTSDKTNTVTLTAPSLLATMQVILTQDDLKVVFDGKSAGDISAITRDKYYDVVNKKVIQGFSNKTLVPPSVPCTSTGGGIGVITFTTTKLE